MSIMQRLDADELAMAMEDWEETAYSFDPFGQMLIDDLILTAVSPDRLIEASQAYNATLNS